ncbi:circumsporozoite protein precursor [Colletotrichum asianum]
MSYSSKTLLISALLAVAEARFGQEQTPVSAVSSLQNVGNPGEAATLAGGIPGVLLAAANPCDKLTLADKIVTQLGDSAEVLDAAKGLVAAEQNFNPFVVSVPNICGDASLPATEALRGIVPLVDPAVTGSDTENTNSATSKTTPFDATGLSVADVMKAQGFSNFTTAGAGGGNAGAGNNTANNGNANNNVDCGNTGNANTGNTANTGNASNNTANAGNNNNNANNGNANTGAVDFGKCTPTMDFQLGRAGRKATEGTFLPTDPLVAQGQQDALNPNIITNRICDQLINVCEANDAAHQQCLDAKAQILASGDKSEAVATTFNGLLGF